MKQIMVPVDFSPISENALKWAMHLAAEVKAAITVVHFHLPPSTDPFPVGIPLDSLSYLSTDAVIHQMRDLIKRMREQCGKEMREVPIDSLLLLGYPKNGIGKTAEENNFDLIVMGTQGADNFLTRIWGTTSTEVAEESCCPVVVVPDEASWQGIFRIGYATAVAAHDIEKLDGLRYFAKVVNAEIICAHVEDDLSILLPPDMADVEVEEGINYFGQSMIRYHAKSVADGLMHFVQEKDIDLLVMTTHARALLEQLGNRGETRKMIMRSERPLMILHKETTDEMIAWKRMKEVQ